MSAPPAVPPDPVRDTRPPGLRSALLDVAAWGLARVPLRWADLAAWAVAWVWWGLVPIRREEAVANLRAALPEVPARPTLVRMFHDLVLGYVELLQVDRVEVVFEGERPEAGVMLAGHGGAWDLALVACGDRFPTSIFLRTPRDRWVQAWLAGLRDRHGVGRLETGATMADAYAALAAGRTVYFVQDQRHNGGPRVPLFGRGARTSLGAAVAALKTGRPVYAQWQWREGVGRHRVRIERLEVRGDAEGITAQLNAWYAERIRERPHGWLWLHRRWA